MKYDLVFEGGGAKGMVFVGALQELQSRGDGFERLLGTSAGAITATLLAAGYSADEMLAALGEREDGKPVFAGFMGQPRPFSDEDVEKGELLRVLRAIDVKLVPGFLERKGGWFSADRFVTWLEARLDAPHPDGTPRAYSKLTLAQFRQATGVELSMVVSDTTDGALLVLNATTAPGCPVVWAVRMSMSIPLLWEEVVWLPAWGQYRGRDLAGHVLVDGGLLSNFPVELFLSDDRQVVAVMGPKQATPVLGLLIDEDLAVPTPRGVVKVSISVGELALVQRIKRLVDTATSAHDKAVLDEYADQVVRLPAKGYGTTEFDMSDARRDALVAAGRAAMARHLDEHPVSPGGAVPRGPGKAPLAARERINQLAVKILE